MNELYFYTFNPYYGYVCAFVNFENFVELFSNWMHSQQIFHYLCKEDKDSILDIFDKRLELCQLPYEIGHPLTMIFV